MSASREKKNRQDLASQGYVDPKLTKASEEKAASRKSNALYTVVAVAFIAVAALVLIFNSGLTKKMHSKAAALEVNGQTYSAAEVNYFYRNAYSSVANSSYVTYYGYDTATSPADQSLNDMAKMLLGVEEDMTWQEYFVKSAKDSLVQISLLAKDAKDNGYTANDAVKAEVQETMDAVAGYAKQSGCSDEAYIQAIYGGTMDMKTFERLLTQQVLVSHYVQDKQDSLTYTVDQMEEYYQSDKECFDVAAFDYLFFPGTAESTTDADGNVVEPTEEESAAAMAKAKEDSQAALEMLKAGDSLETVAAAFEDADMDSVTDASNTGDELSTWVFDESRTAGDMDVAETASGCYVAVFGNVGRQDYKTVNVRHILIQPDTSELDSESETYEDDLAKANEAAKAQAEDILAQWKAGDKTEDSFAELAKEYTADSNAEQGGLYTGVTQGQMVAAFNDWCFDASRNVGDTDVVETNYGYHVMYFSGYGDPAWQITAMDELRNRDMNDWIASLTDGIEAVELKGMQYVG